MKRPIVLMSLSLIFCCCSSNPKNKESNNFLKWIKNNEYNFNEYLVMEFEACHACHSHVVKLIEDGYLESSPKKAIVLIIEDDAELYPVKDRLNESNLLIYRGKNTKSPIIDNLPRVYYSNSDGNLKYETLDIATFEKKIEKMSRNSLSHKTLLTMDVVQVKGVAIPGNENFIVLHKQGQINYDIINYDFLNDSPK